MELKELICRLCAAPGPSGSEGGVREVAAELLRPFVDELRTDNMGNLIAVSYSGTPDAPRIMLAAHLDEVGLIVTGYDKGFLRFDVLGGVDPRMLPAQEVKVLTEPPVYGVVDTLPPHVLSSEDMEKTIEPDKLCIDIGLAEDEAKERVPLGTPVVFDSRCESLGGGILCGRALDDRSCAAVVIRVMELLRDCEPDADIYCLLTAQEELGTRGAVVGAYTIAPELAVVLDVTHARTPDAKKEETLPMGRGAAIGVGPNMCRRVTEELIALAKEEGISYQIEVLRGNSGTDAWPIQVSRGGVATALISLPLKYMHSPVETTDLKDAEAAVALLYAFLKRYGKGGERNA